MQSLRDMIKSTQEAVRAAQEEQARAQRPTSLYGAGSAGQLEPGAFRPRFPLAEQEVQPDVYPERQPVGETESHRNRPSKLSAPVTPHRDSREARAAALRRVLSSPSSLQTAFLVREVLDPPVALREDRDPFA
jgi:hypothetical protein